MMTEFLFVGKI